MVVVLQCINNEIVELVVLRQTIDCDAPQLMWPTVQQPPNLATTESAAFVELSMPSLTKTRWELVYADCVDKTLGHTMVLSMS